jgi:hypothetical protein
MALTITGANLGGDDVILRFTHTNPSLNVTIDMPAVLATEPDRTGRELRVTLPAVNDASALNQWAAGIYTVVAIVTNGAVTQMSNALPMAFAATITSLTPNPVARDGQVTVVPSPHVRLTQPAWLLVAGRVVQATGRLNNSDPLVFDLTGIPAVTNTLVTLRVDGVNSLPIKRVALPPPHLEFDDAQRLTIQ